MYLYQTFCFRDLSRVLGDVPGTAAADCARFESDYKTAAQKIEDIEIAETAFRIDLRFTDFESLVADWTAVKFKTQALMYQLFLESETPLG